MTTARMTPPSDESEPTVPAARTKSRTRGTSGKGTNNGRSGIAGEEADPTPAPDRASPIETEAASIDPREPESAEQIEQLVSEANDGADPGVVLEEAGVQIASGTADSAMCDVTFRYAGSDAGHVAVAGDFNAWSELAHPMRRTDDGFEITVPLERGRRYGYRLLVDGRWQDDPTAVEDEPNGHGDRNAIVST